MPIIIKPKSSKTTTSKLIRDFRKAVAITGIVEKARDRRHHTKPSQVRAQKKISKNRLSKKIKILKHTKNIGPDVIEKMTRRLNTQF
jgi:ribosomal protein S21